MEQATNFLERNSEFIGRVPRSSSDFNCFKVPRKESVRIKTKSEPLFQKWVLLLLESKSEAAKKQKKWVWKFKFLE